MRRRTLIMMVLLFVGSFILFLARMNGVKPLFNSDCGADNNSTDFAKAKNGSVQGTELLRNKIPSTSSTTQPSTSSTTQPSTSSTTQPITSSTTQSSTTPNQLNTSSAIESSTPVNKSNTDLHTKETKATLNATNQTGNDLNVRKKRSPYMGVDERVVQNQCPFSLIPNIVASIIVTKGTVADSQSYGKIDHHKDVPDIDKHININTVASTGTPIFTVGPPTMLLRNRIESVQHNYGLIRLNPHYLAKSGNTVSFENGINVPAGWSQKTTAVYSDKTDEYMIVYYPTTNRKSLKGNDKRALGIYGRGSKDFEPLNVFQFTSQHDKARVLPLTSVQDRGMEMLFVTNAGTLQMDSIQCGQHPCANREVSLGVLRARIDIKDSTSVSFAIDQVHKILSSNQTDIFGISKNPDKNALVVSVCFEITGDIDEGEAQRVLENEWYVIERSTGSNVSLIINSVERNKSVTRIFGFIVDNVTRRQNWLYSKEFEPTTDLQQENYNVKLLLRQTIVSDSFYNEEIKSESDGETSTINTTDEDTLSEDTFSTSSYMISDYDHALVDDVGSVEYEFDD